MSLIQVEENWPTNEEGFFYALGGEDHFFREFLIISVHSNSIKTLFL